MCVIGCSFCERSVTFFLSLFRDEGSSYVRSSLTLSFRMCVGGCPFYRLPRFSIGSSCSFDDPFRSVVVSIVLDGCLSCFRRPSPTRDPSWTCTSFSLPCSPMLRFVPVPVQLLLSPFDLLPRTGHTLRTLPETLGQILSTVTPFPHTWEGSDSTCPHP